MLYRLGHRWFQFIGERLTPLIKTSPVPFVVVALLYLSAAGSTISSAEQAKRPYTVADDIGLAYFGDQYSGQAEALQFSPDGMYFAVDTERGRLDLNSVEDSLRFYRIQDIQNFLKHPDERQAPSPIWVVNRFGKEGPVIREWRWLADSSGVAFLERSTTGKQRLMLADLSQKSIEPLTAEAEDVRTFRWLGYHTFDVRDRNNYVYFVACPSLQKTQTEHPPAIVGTGRNLVELLFPDDPVTASMASSPSYLWAVIGGKRFEVKHNGAPLVTEGGVTLSPDGHSLATILPVAEVPLSWESLYPPYVSSLARIHAGGRANQYVRIDLQSGLEQSLTDAPVSGDVGVWVIKHAPSWSSDGQAILLPGTFVKSKQHLPSRPCVAVVDIPSNTSTCVEMLKGPTDEKGGVEEDYHSIWAASFVSGDKHRVKVIFESHHDWNEFHKTKEYQQNPDGSWHVVQDSGLNVTVRQGMNEAPRVVAANGETSGVVWDPNPQLKNIELGQVSLYKWNDKGGRERKAELYKPSDYKQGQRYPLVIQTHGFQESLFMPAGSFTSSFAATELSTAGIAVLQVENVGACPVDTTEEGPCTVSGYEAIANQLVSDGLVDPERIGIIGFSHTCFHVMEALTTGSVRFKAASITDGLMANYLQYMLFTDGTAHEFDSIIGAKPFGVGLQQWLKRSPGFNLDKMNTPLLVIAGEGPIGLLGMWEPYAGLHYLNKPVDLIVLNSNEHVLTNPAVRLVAQGGTTDWFRFWLQGYEDPDPAKAEQYKRWRDLRKLQEEN